MSLLPSENTSKQVKRESRQTGLDLARVVDVGDDASHMIKCQIIGVSNDLQAVGAPFAVSALVPTLGDVSLPSENDIVAIGWVKGRRPVVLGTMYSKQDPSSIPSYVAGDRVIGHPPSDSVIRLNEDGELRIEGDGGGTTVVATDGEITIDSGSGSKVTVAASGGVTVEASSGDKIEVDQSDGSVRVNGGTKEVVTDVTIATTNSEGGATSLNVETSPKLKTT